MSKKFSPVLFDYATFKKEITEYEDFLNSKDELNEANDILPFFNKHHILSSQIATFFPDVYKPDKIAFEYDIFGDFACDLAIGNSNLKKYCFVEFEDAQKQSLFKEESKFKPSFGTRLEHGHSQVIDWFNKIDNLQNTNDMEERFGSRTIDFYGILIIGRSRFLNDTLTNRLNWRSDNIIIKQKTINILTFDGLLEALKTKLDTIESYKNSIL